MGLLDKLWDDTLAGPRPESGLGRLRKQFSLPLQSNSGKDAVAAVGIDEAFGDGDSPEDVLRVTRSIMIKRPDGCRSPLNGTPPPSPAGSTPPSSPFSVWPGGKEFNRFRRKSLSDAYEPVGGDGGRLGKSHSSPYEL